MAEVGIGLEGSGWSNFYLNRVCFARPYQDIDVTQYEDADFVYFFPGRTMVLDEEKDAIFEDWALRDFHLDGNSPLVDWGPNFVDVDPATPGYQYLPQFDLAGKPRIVDGNADGEATVDVGAYEYQGDEF